MAIRYNYKVGYTVDELKVLLATVKKEREKMIQSASDSGSSYTRIARAEIEAQFNGIIEALQELAPTEFPKRMSKVMTSYVAGGIH